MMEDCSDCADAQADFSLCWMHMSDGTLTHADETARISNLLCSRCSHMTAYEIIERKTRERPS